MNSFDELGKELKQLTDDNKTLRDRISALEAEIELLKRPTTNHCGYCDAMSKELESVKEAGRAVKEQIDDLVGESGGVYGLHLNGDLAPWDEILSGGRFERLESIDHLASLCEEKGTEDGRS